VTTVRQGKGASRCVVTADGERNVWFVGDGAECAVIDPAGPVGDLLGHCDDRRLKAILWTSLWPESVRTAISLADYTGAVTYLHTDDLAIWQQAEPERRPKHSVPDGLVLDIGGLRLGSIHTPGITPGALCWYAPSLSAVFTGETLGPQGAGGGGLPAADRFALLASIRVGLFTLPSSTVVHPGRGGDTRIGTQRWDRRFWS
jgi:glyoxylase-like metal-dependent hydrolase (beta-lactamase superfamily II)